MGLGKTSIKTTRNFKRPMMKVGNEFIIFKKVGLGCLCSRDCVGPQINIIKYDPSAPLHQDMLQILIISTVKNGVAQHNHRIINSFFNWDVIHATVAEQSVLHPIDFANAVQILITSNIISAVKSLIRWSAL